MRIIAVNQLRRVLNNVQDYFFPKNCFNCGEEGAWLCEECKDSMLFIDARFCPFCGKITDLFDICSDCQTRINIKKVFSILKYSDPLTQKLIKSFKYRYLEDISLELAPLIRKFLLKYINLIEARDDSAIIPVPLFWYKKCERGFNQAERLAEIMGEILKIRVEKNLIFKLRKSRNQAEVELEKRFDNLKDAFSLRGIAPKNAIIVDDVFTTGSTVKEVANVLAAHGTGSVQVITLARG